MVPSRVEKPAIVVICGATGSGKGQLARSLAHSLNGELISADSRKIYRKFDIGTAKASLQDRKRVAHHLVDICDPNEVFTAGRFVELADQAIRQIVTGDRVPIVVGGTGLYIRALLHGIVDAPERDERLRALLLDQESDCPGVLYKRLVELDPVVARQLPPTDLVRIVRALEVAMLSGKRFSDMHKAHGFMMQRYRSCQIAPDWPREDLYLRIDVRVNHMMAAGWLKEVAFLMQQGLVSTPAFQAVGYRQLVDHLEGKVGLEEAVAQIKTEHRRYARRQLVWFRAVPELRWLPMPANENDLTRELIKFIRDE